MLLIVCGIPGVWISARPECQPKHKISTVVEVYMDWSPACHLLLSAGLISFSDFPENFGRFVEMKSASSNTEDADRCPFSIQSRTDSKLGADKRANTRCPGAKR